MRPLGLIKSWRYVGCFAQHPPVYKFFENSRCRLIASSWMWAVVVRHFLYQLKSYMPKKSHHIVNTRSWWSIGSSAARLVRRRLPLPCATAAEREVFEQIRWYQFSLRSSCFCGLEYCREYVWTARRERARVFRLHEKSKAEEEAMQGANFDGLLCRYMCQRRLKFDGVLFVARPQAAYAQTIYRRGGREKVGGLSDQIDMP